MNQYALYAVNIDNGGGGSDLFIDQISNYTLDPAFNRVLIAADGAVDPTYVAVMGQNPKARFTTSALATVLATCGISGLAVAYDVDEPGAEMFFQALAEGGTRGGAGTNIKLTVAQGMLLPRTLSAPHNGVASLELELIATYDADAETPPDPIVIETSQNLSGTAGVSEVYTAGPVYVNGSQVEGVQNITLDFGITEVVVGSDGLVWPTYVAIQSRRPSIRVRTGHIDIVNTLGLTGAAQSGTNSVVYLRKVDEGGTRVADATEEHISFTIDEGHIGFDAVSGAHGEVLGTDVVITPTYDGVAAIMVISTTAALP